MSAKKGKTLSRTLQRLIVVSLAPIVALLVIMIIFMGFYTTKFNQISNNVTVSSEFSIDFKVNFDSEMYYFAIGRSDELPVKALEDAMSVAESLRETTVRKESRQAIKHILSYGDNLKLRMYQLKDTENYNSRMIQLENNIKILTKLIQKEIQDYIYYEAGYLAQIQRRMAYELKNVFAGITFTVVIIITFMLTKTFRFSEGISKPIGLICDNVVSVSNGNFDIRSIDANDYEIQVLNNGIQDMAHRIDILLKNVKEEQEAKRNIEFQLLQAQINPHFLYNTLDTIIWLVEADEKDKAIDVVSNLSVFFRTSLSKGASVITLDEEIRHTKSYLKIQQVRYRDILDYSINIADDVKGALVPKLTVQPLVENALYHGIKNKRGKGIINVDCSSSEYGIVITVSDNGSGMDQKRLAEVMGAIKNGDKVGFGLAAVHERIKLYYGPQYGITIASAYGQGTTVNVLLPKRLKELKRA